MTKEQLLELIEIIYEGLDVIETGIRIGRLCADEKYEFLRDLVALQEELADWPVVE